MKDSFPNILVLFVPANCTSKLQVMDVVFQRPFKHTVQQLYNQFQAAQVVKQIESGVEPSKVKLETTAAGLRNELMGFLRGGWLAVKGQPELLKRGFAMCKLGSIQDPAFQRMALLECLRRKLLNDLDEAPVPPTDEDELAGPAGERDPGELEMSGKCVYGATNLLCMFQQLLNAHL